MTRKEQIKEIAQKEMSKYPNFCITAPAFIMGAEWADAHPHWISVEDELPKEHEWILGFSLTRSYVDTYIFNSNVIEAHDITHWMHLSPPPIIISSKKGGEG